MGLFLETKCEGNIDMKVRTLSRHVREGVRNIFRNGWMSFASISSISISLFLFGLFLMFSINISYIASQIENKVEISVYLNSGTTQDEINEVQVQLSGIQQVKTITFVSKEEGLRNLADKLGNSGKDLIESFKGNENPLPDAFVVEVDDPLQVKETVLKIESISLNNLKNPIEKVKYGKDTVEALFKITNIIRTIGSGVVLLLSITAIFLIANTIKITIIARRKEISIMRLVGATNAFIRWPFFVEGALIGFIGSIIPLILLLFGYWNLLNSGKLDLSAFLLQLRPYDELKTLMTVLLLVIGVLIGVFGSLISIRKYLKI
jgi:cell division transport system permease protein